MCECASKMDFMKYQKGDKIDVKILSINKDEKNTWFELTRHPDHMKAKDLDESRPVLQYDDIKVGKKYQAVVLAQPGASEGSINLKNSCPIIIQVSPFVRGLVPFDKIVKTQDLVDHGFTYLSGAPHLQLGSQVEVEYLGDKKFSICNEKPKLEKNSLVICRYIKSIYGRGVTV